MTRNVFKIQQKDHCSRKRTIQQSWIHFCIISDGINVFVALLQANKVEFVPLSDEINLRISGNLYFIYN